MSLQRRKPVTGNHEDNIPSIAGEIVVNMAQSQEHYQLLEVTEDTSVTINDDSIGDVVFLKVVLPEGFSFELPPNTTLISGEIMEGCDNYIKITKVSDGSYIAEVDPYGESEVIVFRHDVAGGYFANIAEVNSFNSASVTAATDLKFSILDQLEDYRRSDGTFQFKMSYPNAGIEAIWEQTSNPVGSAPGVVTGFNLISGTGINTTFIGLATAQAGSAIYDGHVGSNWWYSLGSLSFYGPNGLPASPVGSVTTDLVELRVIRESKPNIPDNAPFVNAFARRFNQSVTGSFSITGSFFTPATTVSIVGQTVNSVTFVSDNEIIVNVTTGTTDGFYDVTVDNGLSTTLAGAFEVKLAVWVDLRAGGDTFTDGTAAGNDIRYRTGMSLTRDANGMSFAGVGIWSSWVKFESLGWTRGSGTKIEWVITKPTAAMMIGIGSDATNETNTAQYSQAETVMYMQNTNTVWGLYGNSGTPGASGNQSSSTSIASATTLKAEFTDDGAAGGTFTLYQLPSANPADWDDTGTVLSTFTIGGSLNPDETNLMPFITTQNGGTQRFVAIKIT